MRPTMDLSKRAPYKTAIDCIAKSKNMCAQKKHVETNFGLFLQYYWWHGDFRYMSNCVEAVNSLKVNEANHFSWWQWDLSHIGCNRGIVVQLRFITKWLFYSTVKPNYMINSFRKRASQIDSNTYQSILIFIENILKNKTNFDFEYLVFHYQVRNIIINPRKGVFNKIFSTSDMILFEIFNPIVY